ncbi:hypothetical protein GCM10010842_20110 [Deinococcus daejeonensis]|uniref:Uncharacterized protein n=1 Tax=Deinococcus daejeonensis TaxID=1007098 RepID=A0ABQ2J365_9DEIO|nr:hypothetical protein GCM10010842_20110 [Deinococcus daejeonensis]
MQNDSLIVRCLQDTPRTTQAAQVSGQAKDSAEESREPDRAASPRSLDPAVSGRAPLLRWAGMLHFTPTAGARP